MADLTDQQEMFCREYLVDFNGTKAAIRAHYSEKTAAQTASRLLRNVKIQARLAKLQQKAASRNDITIDRIISEFAKIGFSDLKNYVQVGEDTILVNSLEDLPPGMSAAVESIQQTKDGVRIKLYNKIEALRDLAKHLGFYEEDNRQKGAGIADIARKFLEDD